MNFGIFNFNKHPPSDILRPRRLPFKGGMYTANGRVKIKEIGKC